MESPVIGCAYVQTMAAYNRWQNDSLIGAADGLPEPERRRERGAFFGSIHATLSHLVWADRMWLSRLAGLPRPNAPNIAASVSECADWDGLRRDRAELDKAIVAWAGSLTDGDLAGELTWHSGATGRDITRPLWLLIVHLFNHQTHHRGQVHAMLTAAGARPDDTDLCLMPEGAPAGGG